MDPLTRRARARPGFRLVAARRGPAATLLALGLLVGPPMLEAIPAGTTSPQARARGDGDAHGSQRPHAAGAVWAVPAPAGAGETAPAQGALGFHDADGRPLPFSSREELLEFLREAEVIDEEPLDSGVTDSSRLLLERDGVRAWAHFQSVEVDHKGVRLSNGEFMARLRDSYRNDCAAWEMADLLGIDSIPPLVPRRVGRREGRVQIWLHDVMTEKQRVERGLQPATARDWLLQVQTMYLFDDLIGNVDRNEGNVLIDRDWRLWLIDHTRAFQVRVDPRHLGDLIWVDRDLWRRLGSLDPAEVRRRLDPWLAGHEIDELLGRVETVRRHVEGLIAERGERVVLVASRGSEADPGR